MRRVMGAALSVVLLITACMGCATGEESAEPTGEAVSESGEEIVWIPEYKTLESVYHMTAVCGTDNGIYYCVDDYREETKSSQVKLFFLDGETKKVSQIPFDGEKEGCLVSAEEMAVLSSGEIVLVMRETDVRTDGGSRLFLRIVSREDGSLAAETDLTGKLYGTGRDDFTPAMAVDQEDQILLTNDVGGFRVYNKELQEVSFLNLLAKEVIWGIGKDKEGRVVCLKYSGLTSEKPELYVLQSDSGSVAGTYRENVPLPKETEAGDKSLWARNMIAAGREHGILLKTASGLAQYDMETETAVSVLSWEDIGIDAGSVSFFTVLADGRILLVLEDMTSVNGYCRVAFLSDTPAAEILEKEIITLGVLGVNSDMSDAVFEFNRNNDRYQIEIVNYWGGSKPRGSMDDLEESMIHFTSEIAAGKGPDMFSLNGVNMKMLAEKGIIEDLYPYFEEDPELNKEDYFLSVLNAYSVDGKLCGIPSFFTVQTAFAKTSVVGEEGGWTIGEMMEYVKAGPKGCAAFGHGSKDYNLRECLMFASDSFMNWESGECRLNEEDFIQVLEFANTFSDENGMIENPEGLSWVERMRNGQILVEAIALKSVQDYLGYTFEFGEPITAIGYPASEGIGSAISGISTYAINAQSDKKEGAWEFIRGLLTEEYYETRDASGFPALIRAYERQNEEYMTPIYYETADGEKEEIPQTTYERDGVRVEIFAATQEDVDAVTKIIEECDRAYLYDMAFLQIVSEEAAPYFAGQKSAQEVADIIQNRVQLYMDESR